MVVTQGQMSTLSVQRRAGAWPRDAALRVLTALSLMWVLLMAPHAGLSHALHHLVADGAFASAAAGTAHAHHDHAPPHTEVCADCVAHAATAHPMFPGAVAQMALLTLHHARTAAWPSTVWMALPAQRYEARAPPLAFNPLH